MITVTQARENDRTTFCRQFTFNKNGYSNREVDGAVVSGIPVAGIPVSNLPDGTLISIPENGSPVLFYKAKSDYESDLNGTGLQLLVRKDIYDSRVWNTERINTYATCSMDSWMNNDYMLLLPTGVRDLITKTKIRYTPGGGNNSLSVLERFIFQMSCSEIGRTGNNMNIEGTALPISSMLQVAYLNGAAYQQHTRTPATTGTTSVWGIGPNGSLGSLGVNASQAGSRPCFCLPSTSVVSITPNPDGSYNLIY